MTQQEDRLLTPAEEAQVGLMKLCLTYEFDPEDMGAKLSIAYINATRHLQDESVVEFKELGRIIAPISEFLHEYYTNNLELLKSRKHLKRD